MKSFLSFVGGPVVIVGLSIGLSGCTRAPSMPPPQPTPVSFSYPIEREVTDYADFTGKTVAVDSVEVRAHVWGYLEKIKFIEGAIVKKGDILFEIDPRPFEAALNQAKADLESKQAAEVKAQAVYKRTTVLVKTNAASLEDVDTTKGDWLVAKANIFVSKGQLETAELNLGYTKVRALISGRTSKFNVTVGNIIQSGDQGGGTLLTTIVSMDPMYAEFDVDEHTVLHVRELIRQGKAKSVRDPKNRVGVTMSLANEGDFTHEGTLNFADNQVNSSTGTMRARATFPNEDEVLTPGMFVRVRVPIGEPYKAILVSDRAIDADQGQKIVYVVNEKNEVVIRPVQLGALHDGLRVVEIGLSPGERVVVNGLQQIRPGAVVDPKEVDMPVNPALKKSIAEAKKQQTAEEQKP
jgi:RND family efflux transporter MFP subunit